MKLEQLNDLAKASITVNDSAIKSVEKHQSDNAIVSVESLITIKSHAVDLEELTIPNISLLCAGQLTPNTLKLHAKQTAEAEIEELKAQPVEGDLDCISELDSSLNDHAHIASNIAHSKDLSSALAVLRTTGLDDMADMLMSLTERSLEHAKREEALEKSALKAMSKYLDKPTG